MKLTEQQVEQAKKSKDPLLKAFYEHYVFVTSNAVYESYVARMMVLNKWNQDLIDNPVSILSLGSAEDVMNVDKQTDRILKFMEKQPQLIEGTDAMRVKLSPQDQDQVLQDKRFKASKDLAFG